jgi:NADH:ubiquinone oxidoreductase subunit 5 (subunit L)/multisubunit Na+/H+ antiporter MnhA subunit
MYYILFFLPLMSAIIAGLGGRYVGEKGAARITTSLIILTSLLS